MGTNVHYALGFAVQNFLYVMQNGAPVAGTCDHVSFFDGGSFVRKRLRITPGQNRYSSWILPLRPAQPFTAFLVAEVGHGTAVDHINVCAFVVGNDRVTAFFKKLRQGAGFVLVYLATQGVKCYPHGDDSFTIFR